MLLAHELLLGQQPAPQKWMFVLHGILGRRANWRGFMRRVLQERPGWGAVLVDLRQHGESQGFPGPHTVAAAAQDLVSLRDHVEAEHGGRVAGLLGHSFGGKVALAGSAALRGAGAGAGGGLEELWIIDAPPGRRPEPKDLNTTQVFEVLGSLPPSFASRRAFTDAVMAAGISKRTAQWLATNVVGEGEQWRFGLELGDVRALLDDFAAIDLWPSLIELSAELPIALVLGERSEAVFGAERERALAEARAGRLAVEVIPKAAHWVHVDAPAALLSVLVLPPQVGQALPE